MINKETLQDKQFQGEVTHLKLSLRSRSQSIREALAVENYDPGRVIAENMGVLVELPNTPFGKIGQKIVKGEPLSFEESFLGMIYVVSATNTALFSGLKASFEEAHGLTDVTQAQLVAPAQTFLTSMAQKELMHSLSAEEIAGMAGAGMMDVNLRLGFRPYVLETCGMGGDRGFSVNGEKQKVINLSTLSSIVLSAMGLPVLKHGSYANTSAVGSTDAIEKLGVDIGQMSFRQIKDLFDKTGFYFSDAHISKTLHDLSHNPFMRHETINHIVGPMTPPVDRDTVLNKVIGVNEGIHPQVIARAYEVMDAKGIQRIGNVAVVSGLNAPPDGIDVLSHEELEPYMVLDELSPLSSLVAIVRAGTYEGCFVISPQDFGVSLDASSLSLTNSKSVLMEANIQALSGRAGENTKYLAMNCALGLFLAEYLDRKDAIINGRLNSDYLSEAFERCFGYLMSGQALTQLDKIIEVSQEGVKE